MKKILRILLFLFLAYAVWLGVGIVSYRQWDSIPAQDSMYEVEGMYHLHTTHSDGRKTPEEIAHIADRAGLDFIILTDHGSPNFGSLETAGKKEGLFVLAGSELSTSRGHLVALDFAPPSGKFISDADAAALQIIQYGGFSIIAHPYSKTQWTWGDSVSFSGIEIINADSMLKDKIWRWIPYTPALFLRPRFFLLKILKSPQRNLLRWDTINKTHRIFGYYSTDAHLLYKPLTEFLRLHVLLDRPLASDFEEAQKQIYSALRKGSFYSAIDAAAKARGFRFWTEGEGDVGMGSTVAYSSPTELHVQLPLSVKKETHILENGQSVFQSPDDSIVFLVERAGIYRIEVYLRDRSPLNKKTPWILSNPIFLEEKRP